MSKSYVMLKKTLMDLTKLLNKFNFNWELKKKNSSLKIKTELCVNLDFDNKVNKPNLSAIDITFRHNCQIPTK